MYIDLKLDDPQLSMIKVVLWSHILSFESSKKNEINKQLKELESTQHKIKGRLSSNLITVKSYVWGTCINLFLILSRVFKAREHYYLLALCGAMPPQIQLGSPTSKYIGTDSLNINNPYAYYLQYLHQGTDSLASLDYIFFGDAFPGL